MYYIVMNEIDMYFESPSINIKHIFFESRDK